MSGSDAIFNVKKNVGYAKFFLQVGKRSDARRRLQDAVDVVDVASRSKMTTDDESIELMDLVEEIMDLWRESLDTVDPPGASFLLAMGDMVFLTGPGGNTTVVDLKKNYSSGAKPSVAVAPSPAATTTSPASVPVVSVVSPATGNSSSGSGGLRQTVANLFGIRRNPSEQSASVPPPETSLPLSTTPVPPTAPFVPPTTNSDPPPTSASGPPSDSSVLEPSGVYDKNNTANSQVIRLENEKGDPNLPISDQVNYSIVQFGENFREKVFEKALEGISQGSMHASTVGRRNRRTNTIKYFYDKYFHPVCYRQRPTLGEQYEMEFLRYVFGEADTSLVIPTGETVGNDVTRFDVMMLQTVPARVSRRTRNLPGPGEIDDTENTRWISSFAFLRLEVHDLYISLICSAQDKPLISEGNRMDNGQLMMQEIYKVAKSYGYSNVSLGSVPTAIGIYMKRGFRTKSDGFNKFFEKFHEAVRSEGEYTGVDKVQYSKAIKDRFKTIDEKIENLRQEHNKDIAKVPFLGYLEDRDVDLYREELARDILEKNTRSLDHLVSVIVKLSEPILRKDMSEWLKSILDILTGNLINIYIMDKEGSPEIFMTKDISGNGIYEVPG